MIDLLIASSWTRIYSPTIRVTVHNGYLLLSPGHLLRTSPRLIRGHYYRNSCIWLFFTYGSDAYGYLQWSLGCLRI